MPGLVRVQGTACGTAIDYEAPAEANVDLTRASWVEDSQKVFVVQASDNTIDEAPLLPRFLEKHDLFINLSFEHGFVPAVGKGTHLVRRGTIMACGLGTVVVADGISVDVEILQIGPPRSAGQLKMTIKHLVPKGFSTTFGSLQVPGCNQGDLTVTIDAPYIHEPG